MAAKLGQLLVKNKVVTEDQLAEAIEVQQKDGGRVGSNLVKLNYISEDELVEFLSKQYGVTAVLLIQRLQQVLRYSLS